MTIRMNDASDDGDGDGDDDEDGDDYYDDDVDCLSCLCCNATTSCLALGHLSESKYVSVLSFGRRKEFQWGSGKIKAQGGPLRRGWQPREAMRA